MIILESILTTDKASTIFEAAGAVMEISSSLRFTNCNQVKLAQIHDTYCRRILNAIQRKCRVKHFLSLAARWKYLSICFGTFVQWKLLNVITMRPGISYHVHIPNDNNMYAVINSFYLEIFRY